MFSKSKNKTYIIAEIGGNFTTYEEAIKLIDAAYECGVDCIKIQTFKADTIAIKGATFDMENIGKIPQYEYFKKYEINKETHKRIFNYIETKGIDYFSTPSHITDVDMLEELGVKAYKIGADDATNIPLLKYIAKKGKYMVISTGMCTLQEVKEAVNSILEEGNNKIAILHTVSGYPTQSENVNLNILNTFKKEFSEYLIGISDHTLTPISCIAAASIGVNIIEKHFTIDKNADGPDHILSLLPQEMKYLVDSVREIEKMKGTSIKMPFGPEIKNRINNRKSIVVSRDIKKGEILTEEDLDIKRPGYGIEPKYINSIIGKEVREDMLKDELILWSSIR